MPSEREALTAAKRSVLIWVNDEEQQVGMDSGRKFLNILKCTWDDVDWHIWIHCIAKNCRIRVFYYVYDPEKQVGHLTPFVPTGTFYEKEGG